MAKLTLTAQLQIALDKIASLESQLASTPTPTPTPPAAANGYPRFVEAYSDTRTALNAAVARNKAGLHCKVLGRSLFALDQRTFDRLQG